MGMWQILYFIATLVAFGSWIFALMAKWHFVKRVRVLNHPVWERLGRPSIFREWIVGSASFARFIWRQEYNAFADPDSTVWGARLRIAGLIHVASLSLVAVLFIFRWIIRF